MTTGIVFLNFGEPDEPTPERVTAFLERIFLQNATLEDPEDEERARARSRELARRRAPGLAEDYAEIGGSPLNEQAAAQAEAVREELTRRGHEARAYVGLQFTEPLIADAVEKARRDGVDRLVGLAVYPLCGPSTTVAALSDLRAAVRASGWDVPLSEVSGWHRHPDYVRLRADRIATHAASVGADLRDPGTTLLFSVHGTPVRYLEEGSRYREYAEEHCADVADALGLEDYLTGYQNHANRDVEWTRPDVEDVVRRAAEAGVACLVVDAVSFVHEQSETLAELDVDLREEAERAGAAFHRVPVPHDDPRLTSVLADLVEPLLEAAPEGGVPDLPALSECRCRPGARCTNGARPAAEAPA